MLVHVQPGIAGHVASDQYGKYGVIRESDLASKVSEFQQWATEVKKVNIEAMAKWEEKELFAEFVEDYNTGTLPHRKYYDLMAYAQQKAIKAAKRGRNAGVSPQSGSHQLACHSSRCTNTSSWVSTVTCYDRDFGDHERSGHQNGIQLGVGVCCTLLTRRSTTAHMQ